jgi:hypothetical protein
LQFPLVSFAFHRLFSSPWLSLADSLHSRTCFIVSLRKGFSISHFILIETIHCVDFHLVFVLLRVAKSKSVIAGAGNECETATSCMLNISIITSIVHAWNSDFHPDIEKKIILT